MTFWYNELMHKIATFRYILIRSLTDRTYYHELLSTPFKFSLKFLSALIFLIVTINITALSIQLAFFIPDLPQNLDAFHSRVSQIYPKDLEITVENGLLSINKPTPYDIDIPELNQQIDVDHTITFDPQAEISDFDSYDTLMLVTDQEIIYKNYSVPNTPYEVLPFSQIQESTLINRQDYDNLMAQLDSVFDSLKVSAPYLLAAFTVIAPFLFTLISVAWELFNLILLTAILYFVSRAFKVNLSFWKLYQLGMHGLAVPLSFKFFLTMMGIHIPMLFASAFLLWMVLVLSRFEKSRI